MPVQEETQWSGAYVITVKRYGGYGSATWIAINECFPEINNETISNRWLAKNIQQGHGPLGADNPDIAYGMEGDTPSWLSLIPTGLSDPEHQYQDKEAHGPNKFM